DWLGRLRGARGHSFVYPLQSYEGKELWYVIHRGQARGVLPAPAEGGNAAATADAVAAAFAGGPAGPGAAPAGGGVVRVDAWFRRHAGERQRTLAPAQALALCRPAGA